MRKPALLLFLGLAMAPRGVWAQTVQNMDIYFLFGARHLGQQQIAGSDVTISNDVRRAVGVGYGYQVARFSAAGLWLEFLPSTFSDSGVRRASIPGPVDSGFSIFAPGLRVMAPVHSRVSLYGAAGYGWGRFYYPVIVEGNTESVKSNSTTHGVFSFGGGADIRLSRHFSIRGELRDFVTGIGLSGSTGRHHPVPLAGLALHF